MKPRIAIISFPGTNGDTENLRTLKRCGFDAFVFRWNDSREKLQNADGYFIGAGFAYEDRGRAGMVAARDPLLQFLHEEAAKGKVIVGNCNGCQVLVESGLIPLGDGLRMSLARNVTRHSSKSRLSSDDGQMTSDFFAPGFLNEWIWITPSCTKDRCATSDWMDSTDLPAGQAGSPQGGAMHIPMAHGEGRFVTKDKDLIDELKRNDQIAFRYCDESGMISEDPSVTLNGSTYAIAGICNPAGNVVALMPHPERTVNGDPYFVSMRKWIENKSVMLSSAADPSIRSSLPLRATQGDTAARIEARHPQPLEIFIDTIIVNNEERTVEQAARRIVPDLRLKQFRYLAPQKKTADAILTTISHFNPNKEVAFVRRGTSLPALSASTALSTGSVEGRDVRWFRWNSTVKKLESTANPLRSVNFIRRDEPDVGAAGIGGGETGICYSCDGISDGLPQKLQEILANPHASNLSKVID